MRYVSTRGLAPGVSFEDGLLRGLASDGGLYMPESWPALAPDGLRRLAAAPFPEIVAEVLAPFAAPWMDMREIAALAAEAYRGFDHPRVAPLRRLDKDFYLLELFHGPTLAFKDIAMQLLARLFERALRLRSERLTILCATSGDTGGAAVEAFGGAERVRLVVLHPKGRVSDVQRRMMTTANKETILNIGVAGDFDDCQRIVKALLGDAAFREEARLGAVNSINWARLAIQIAYYVSALADLFLETGATSASFFTPTGNFGDAFAGYAAKRMGAGVRRVTAAVNRNDMLRRAIEDGVYRRAAVSPSCSPSMDIGDASNFERLIFEASGRDAAKIRELMNAFADIGSFNLPDAVKARIGEDFAAARVEETECAATIARLWRDLGILIDPHTAIGVAAARRAKGNFEGPAICLATAHPAKFPDAVFSAAGVRPDLPGRHRSLHEKPEVFLDAPAVIDVIKDRVRAFSAKGA